MKDVYVVTEVDARLGMIRNILGVYEDKAKAEALAAFMAVDDPDTYVAVENYPANVQMPYASS